MSEPLSISVTPSNDGPVTMTFAPGASVPGTTGVFSVAGETVKITAPQGTPANPLQIRIRVDSSRVSGTTALRVTRNGVVVADCAVPATLPCVVATSTLPDGDREWIINTLAASSWAVIDSVASPFTAAAADVVGWW